MQTHLFILALVLTAAIIVVFLYIFISSLGKHTKEGAVANPLRSRFWFMMILLVVIAIFTSVTIPKSPYYLFKDETPSRVVHVGAMQYAFLFSDNAITPTTPAKLPTFELKTNELVEFRVTSLDVNHGFGIYDPSHMLVAQVQAMPGYVNRLRWKFDKPGQYTILCLEFCGLVHQSMRATFTVK
jgi:cytochrome c oxidase subunit 2